MRVATEKVRWPGISPSCVATNFRISDRISSRLIGIVIESINLRRPTARGRTALCSDAAGGVGEVEPDFYAAEVRAFGADGGGDVGAEVAGGANVFGELGMDLAELGDLIHAGGVDFFLGVEAGAHGPFVEEVEEGAGLDETDGFGVGEEIESDFWLDACIDEFIFGGPGVLHAAVVEFLGARILREESGSDVVGLARVG